MVTTQTKPQRGEFANEPFVDFSKPENRKAMEEALKKLAAELGREYPLYIAGAKVETSEKIRSTNPSRPDQVVGIFQKAIVELANRAVDEANRAFERWKRVPAEERSACLFRAADILRRRKFEMGAWVCYEVGKTWPEANVTA